MIYENVMEIIGNTPSIKLNNFIPNNNGSMYIKMEGFNPGGSMKDRVAKFIIEEAEANGQLKKGGTIVESSSGNLAIGLAIAGRQKGYKVITVVDPKITSVNLSLIKAFGAEIYMVNEPDQFDNYLLKRIEAARELTNSITNAYWPNQYNNINNSITHERSTAFEIYQDFGQKLDWVVVPVGTAGLITGLARKLKELIPNIKVLAVDAKGSVTFGTPPDKRLQTGIGASIIPPNLTRYLYDEIIHVIDEDAFATTRKLALKEGLLVGGSTGSAVHAAELLAQKNQGSNILVMSPDRGDRYFNTIFSDDWLNNNGINVKYEKEHLKI